MRVLFNASARLLHTLCDYLRKSAYYAQKRAKVRFFVREGAGTLYSGVQVV